MINPEHTTSITESRKSGDFKKRFDSLEEEFKSYMNLAAYAGPHSSLGKFYRRQAQERESELGPLITEIMRTSGYPDYDFQTVYAQRQQGLRTYIRPMTFILDIVGAGWEECARDADFRKVIVAGALAMSPQVSGHRYLDSINGQINEFIQGGANGAVNE